MPSVRRRRKEQRPAEILASAFEEFSTRGFAGTRLDDVAERAGITKGTIYVYFDSKEDLFVEALKAKTMPVFENLATLSQAPQGSALAILKDHLAFVARHMVEDPCKRDVVRILMAEGQRFPDVVDRWHAEVIAPALEAIDAIIRYGIARGEFRASAIADFPHLILAPAMFAINWQAIYGDRQPFEVPRFLATAMDVFATGLLASKTALSGPDVG